MSLGAAESSSVHSTWLDTRDTLREGATVLDGQLIPVAAADERSTGPIWLRLRICLLVGCILLRTTPLRAGA